MPDVKTCGLLVGTLISAHITAASTTSVLWDGVAGRARSRKNFSRTCLCFVLCLSLSTLQVYATDVLMCV
ncbi:hypothetical protein F5Y07DRAFT_361810 [Xylaria sp. FL0933]|nr:hypothetical protein F5Y07DRAFT_361810 [Xylaria sp. FL0933]